MKIAIHCKNQGFCIRWVSYCKKNNIEYKLVDCCKNDIISQLNDCDALMWQPEQNNYQHVLFAKQLLFSIQQSGKKVFPDFNTCWHFDDKVGQKYLLESIGAPLVPSYVFYTKTEAMEWVKNTNFPKVFKLRGGAGSANVKLVKSAFNARKLIRKAFSTGFSPHNKIENLNERIRKYKKGNDSKLNVFKAFVRLFVPANYSKMSSNEKGYIYFQDYIPNNSFDIRVIVIGEKAFAIKRIVRKNDFRASGSGNVVYNKENFPIDTIELSFLLSEKMKTQCIAYDFVYDVNGNALVVEISYGFATSVYDSCVGYWDKSLNFIEGSFIPQDWMVELILKLKEN
ncbi:MAG: hypothetical protein WCG08_15370 [Paludibacter sp.]